MPDMQETTATTRSGFWPLAFFGVSSVIFAEAFSGSSPLWFINGGFILVVPLYSSHAILLLNLAIRYRKTNLTQLYLWGIIFGLYESWITKVIWAGYMQESGPAIGTVLGFAIPEFFVIALFWHAVFAFIVPILVFEILAYSTSARQDDAIIPSHREFIIGTRRNKIMFALVFLIGTYSLTPSLGNLGAVLIASVGNTVIFMLLAYLARSRTRGEVSIKSLVIGKRGMAITVEAILIQYVLLGSLILPERFPGPITILLTIAFYGVIIALIYASPDDVQEPATVPQGNVFQWKTVKKWFGAYVVLSLLWPFVIGLAFIIFALFYLAMIGLGPLLFLLAVYRVLGKKWQSR